MSGRSKSSKSIVICSDIHVGDNHAICTKSPQKTDGENYTPNKLQRALLDCWKEAWKDLVQKPTAIVINGEPINGANKHSMGAGVWSTSLVDQIRDFKKLMKSAPTSDKLVFVRGSGYHVTADGATPMEEIVAEEMKADRYRTYGGSGYTDEECNIEMHGKYFNFTHHVGFAQWAQYKPTSLAKEMVKMHFDNTKRGVHTDITVRSHVHYYVEIRFPNTIGFTTPAWKMPDGFMYRRGIPSQPDIGLMEVIIEPNGKVIVEPHITSVEVKPKVMHI